jgi:DNA helicase II / ATP-dependent DNA helicase PcrA
MSDSSVAQTKRLHSMMRRCLSLYNPRSFFLLAGAGSGKTRALVGAMKILRKKHGEKLRLSNRKVVVITYTNA